MEEVYGVSEIFLPEYSLNIHILHKNHQQYLQHNQILQEGGGLCDL